MCNHDQALKERDRYRRHPYAPSFRDAWRKAQHCFIPAESFFEPDWRSGHAVPTSISRKDGALMDIARLWARWTLPHGQIEHS